MRSLNVVAHALGLLLLAGALPGRASDSATGSAVEPRSRVARDLLRELVEIDTTPPNGSTRAAEAMAARLRAGGFAESEVLLLGPSPDRQNLVVRLRGNGPAKPILLIAHLDVVDAPLEGWSPGLEPFRLTERDGFLYGRGVVDDKNSVAALVASLLRLRAERFVPDRDVTVALTADEESGGANGVSWLIAERRDLIEAAYCVNTDAGGGQIEGGRRVRLAVQTSEKAYLSFRIEARSRGGHSSLPGKDNAIDRLAAGIVRLSRYEFPFRFNETTRAYFERRSRVETGQVAADLRAVASDPPDLEAVRRLAARSTLDNAILHTTCVPTRLEGGHADNALPQTARAILNCRVFPDETLELVQRTINEVLSDAQIQVTPLGSLRPAPVSALLPEVFEPIERVSRSLWPDVLVLPVMDPWASDSVRLRRAGIPTFGVSGTFTDDSAGAHGADERLSTLAFDESVEFLYRLLKELTSSHASSLSCVRPQHLSLHRAPTWRSLAAWGGLTRVDTSH